MSSKNPLVSVVITCYNYAHYLPEAVESVLRQTNPHLECIIVNDGSQDETAEVALQYCSRDSRVRYLHQANQGTAAARNSGIAMATGDYILPLDADDTIAASYAEKAVAILEKNPNTGIVYCDAQFFGSSTEPFTLQPFSFPGILLGNQIFATAFFLKKDWATCGGYNRNMAGGWEDFDFWLSIIELKRDVYKIPEVLFYYRQGHRSRSDGANRMQSMMFSQLAKNHPSLYIENSQYLFDTLLAAQHENIEAAAIKCSYTYRYFFKYFFKAERLLKKLFRSGAALV